MRVIRASRASGQNVFLEGSAEDFPEIGYIELAPDGIKNHMAPYYREALAVVAAGRGVAIEAEPRVDETFLRWYKRAERQ